MNNKKLKGKALVIALAIIVVLAAISISFIYAGGQREVSYVRETTDKIEEVVEDKIKSIKGEEVEHQETPEHLKGIYMTSWVAGTSSWREELISYIEATDLNAIVIDIKDDTGRISFEVEDEYLKEIGSSEERIADLESLIENLHEKGIYVIGRVSVFQDPYFVKKFPEEAVRRESDGQIWSDRKGLTWIDPNSKKAWQYVVAIARESYSRGFDEINFDYIRFPSDGDIKDIHYPKGTGLERAEVVESFFKHLDQELGDEMTISADLFGLVTVAEDDLGIGQEIMRAMPYFDFICPMVYPSHFAPGTFGYGNPASYPYEIINESIGRAIERITSTSTKEFVTVGTTTKVVYKPKDSFPKEKIRPWIQDFDLGAQYGKVEVEAQIKALNDLGLQGYMIWDPSNKYSRSVSY